MSDIILGLYPAHSETAKIESDRIEGPRSSATVKLDVARSPV